MNLSVFDCVAIVVSCIGWTLLAFVCRRKSSDWSPNSVIAFRIALIHLSIAIFCAMTTVSVTFFGFAAIYVVIAVVCISLFDFTDNVVGIALYLALIAPAWIIQQWVLGFPDSLKPPQGVSLLTAIAESSQVAIPETGMSGTVVTPLRPEGKVDIDGQPHTAAAASGQFIDVGEQVEVCGRRNRTLLVRPTNGSSSKV